MTTTLASPPTDAGFIINFFLLHQPTNFRHPEDVSPFRTQKAKRKTDRICYLERSVAKSRDLIINAVHTYDGVSPRAHNVRLVEMTVFLFSFLDSCFRRNDVNCCSCKLPKGEASCQEAEQYGFYLFQWENFGLVLTIFLSGAFALSYASIIVGFRAPNPESKVRYGIFIFLLVLLCTYCVVVLARTADDYFVLEQPLQAYAVAFMGLHLAIVAILSTIFLAWLGVNEDKKSSGPQIPGVVASLFE